MFARVCGAKLPDGYQPDGEDLTAALRGELPQRSHPLFWEYGRNTASFAYPKDLRHRSPNLGVRDGQWKLLINADGSGVELYDVVADRNEERNLAGDQPDVVQRLSVMALEWRKSLP